jgi:hypothetical protein
MLVFLTNETLFFIYATYKVLNDGAALSGDDALRVILHGMDGERAMGEGHEMTIRIVGGGAK